MGFVTNDQLIGAVSVPPSRLQPGDTVADIGRTTMIRIDHIEPIKINYRDYSVPVWLIKGHSDFLREFRTVCVPRQNWYLLRRGRNV